MKQKIKNWLASIGLVGMMSVVIFISPNAQTVSLKYFKKLIPNYAQTQDSQKDTRLPTRGLPPIWGWLDRLAEDFECAGCAPNYKRIDSNGKYSYGCLQFQEATFKTAIRKYQILPDIEDNEIMNRIYDCDLQKIVAAHIWKNEGNLAYYHWKTSIDRGAGMPPGYAKPTQN